MTSIDARTIIDEIDEPIREAILHLNRIGVITLFSCYGGKKWHESNNRYTSHAFPYLSFLTPIPEPFFTVMDAMVRKEGWKLTKGDRQTLVLTYYSEKDPAALWSKLLDRIKLIDTHNPVFLISDSYHLWRRESRRTKVPSVVVRYIGDRFIIEDSVDPTK